jgi:hypothetical protein
LGSTSPFPLCFAVEREPLPPLSTAASSTTALPQSPKPAVRTGKIPSIFFCSRFELNAFASLASLHSDEALAAFYPWVHRGSKRRLVYGLWTHSTGFLVEKQINIPENSRNLALRPLASL